MVLTAMAAWTHLVAQLAALSIHPGQLVSGAAVAAAALLAVTIAVHLVARVRVAADQPDRRAFTLRERGRRRPVPRQLDPDAAGRPRPRAPSAHPGLSPAA